MVSSLSIPKMLLVVFALFLTLLAANVECDFKHDFDVMWGDGRVQTLDNGQTLTLSLDNNSGSGFNSKNEFLFGKFDMQLKLVPGNSAGTVTTYYFHSNGSSWDEIDFEFLGNISGEPYTVHTNVYTLGQGSKEQQFHLWFDPTKELHTYSVLWNPKNIVFYIDGIPIRQFKNLERIGIPFPKRQPMKLYASLWNADQWATMGGLVKTNWTEGPFVATFSNFTAHACVKSSGTYSCSLNSHSSSSGWFKQGLDAANRKKLKWVQNNYMIYNYCKDSNRFPQALPSECAFNS